MFGQRGLEPVEAHVYGFGSVLSDGRVHDAICSAVVCSDGGVGGWGWGWPSSVSVVRIGKASLAFM